MNQLDIVIMAVLALMGLRGLLRGLIKEVAALTALVLGGWLAYRFHDTAAAPLKPFMPVPGGSGDLCAAADHGRIGGAPVRQPADRPG